MDLGSIVVLVTAVAVAAYAIVIYNGLVNLKHNVAKAWANIDVLLKQRHDELPKLVQICRQYMLHERDTLERVISARQAVSAARAAGDVGSLGTAETALRRGLGTLFAVAEAYPDLKADKTFKHLQERISALENAIADRREYYNESVNRNNTRIEQFPDVVIARWFAFGERALLEFTADETKDVDLRELFSRTG